MPLSERATSLAAQLSQVYRDAMQDSVGEIPTIRCSLSPRDSYSALRSARCSPLAQNVEDPQKASHVTIPMSAPTSPAIPSRAEEIDLDGHRITIRTWDGAGPRILLIHGISSAGSAWSPVIPALAAEFTPVAIDMRGHGASSKPERGYLYDDYIHDLEGVLAALGMEYPLIMGHSLGGIVTLWWASRHPDTAAALVIEDSPLRSGLSFMPAFDSWLELNALPATELRARFAAENPHWSATLLDERTALMSTTARNVFAELRADSLAHHGADRLAEIEAIRSPTLLIHGDLETGGMVVPADAEAFVQRLPNARA
ncbi:MAG: hypothetical protein AVDCRST_MAG87-1062, partial [uncultured Thermomicrobiales bacterium]